MPCKICNSDFNIFNWKFKCGECSDKYCKKCLKTMDGVMYCEKCTVLLKRPPDRSKLMELKSKDLQDYLQKHNVPTRGLVEKQELVDLLCTRPIPVKQKRGAEKLAANFGGSVPNLGTSAINDFIGNLESTIFSKCEQKFGGAPFQNPPHAAPPPPPRQPSRNSYRATNASHSHSEMPSPQSHPRPQFAGRSTAPPYSEPTTTHQSPSESNGDPFVPSAPPPSAEDIPTEPQPTTSSGYPSNDKTSDSASSSPILSRYPKLSDIQSLEELSNLSSKQLKALLTLNRVDYKGCVEKTELLERAERLWTDSIKHKEQLPEDLDELCKLCMDAPLDCVLLECGHIATCINCGKRLAECPICRQYVSRVVRTFKA